MRMAVSNAPTAGIRMKSAHQLFNGKLKVPVVRIRKATPNKIMINPVTQVLPRLGVPNAARRASRRCLLASSLSKGSLVGNSSFIFPLSFESFCFVLLKLDQYLVEDAMPTAH